MAPSRKSSMGMGVLGVGVAAGWGSRGQGSGWKGTLENPGVHQMFILCMGVTGAGQQVGCEAPGPPPEARVTSLGSSLGDQEGASGTPKRSSHTGGIGWIH